MPLESRDRCTTMESFKCSNISERIAFEFSHVDRLTTPKVLFLGLLSRGSWHALMNQILFPTTFREVCAFKLSHIDQKVSCSYSQSQFKPSRDARIRDSSPESVLLRNLFRVNSTPINGNILVDFFLHASCMMVKPVSSMMERGQLILLLIQQRISLA